MLWTEMDLDPRLQRAIAKLKFENPTLVQETGIPLALQGKDILAKARTGSGKTAAYCIPVIQKILSRAETTQSIQALFLVPTKELAEQVTRHVRELSMYCTSTVKVENIAIGDVSLASQIPILAEFPTIIVSTPSRIRLHLEAGNLILQESLESLVIDEADLILSYGYDEDVTAILKFFPQIYQSYLMSATLSSDVEKLKKLVLRNAAILQLEESEEENMLTQYHTLCSEEDKYLLMLFMFKLRVHPFGSKKTIIFVNSIDKCYQLKLFLEQFGIKSCTLNSELPVKSRYHIVQEFNRGVYDFIIATDESADLKGMVVDSDDEDDAEIVEGVKESKTETKEEESENIKVDEVVEVENNDEKVSIEAASDDEEMVSVDKGSDDEEAKVSENDDSEDKVKEELKVEKIPEPEPEPEPKKKSKKSLKRKFKQDSDYGVSRGIDFQNVTAVINFDIPRSSKNYQHRVGRTARGVGNKGYSLTFVCSDAPAEIIHTRRKSKAPPKIKVKSDEYLLGRIEKRQEAMGNTILPFKFDMEPVERFRYRCQDALRTVSSGAVRDARVKEIKTEILNSEKLKAHFEDNPADLRALRHDGVIHPTKVQSHMKHVPTYMLPKGKLSVKSGESTEYVPFKMDGNRRKKKFKKSQGAASKRKSDPLKSFKFSK